MRSYSRCSSRKVISVSFRSVSACVRVHSMPERASATERRDRARAPTRKVRQTPWEGGRGKGGGEGLILKGSTVGLSYVGTAVYWISNSWMAAFYAMEYIWTSLGWNLKVSFAFGLSGFGFWAWLCCLQVPVSNKGFGSRVSGPGLRFVAYKFRVPGTVTGFSATR